MYMVSTPLTSSGAIQLMFKRTLSLPRAGKDGVLTFLTMVGAGEVASSRQEKLYGGGGKMSPSVFHSIATWEELVATENALFLSYRDAYDDITGSPAQTGSRIKI